MALFASLADLRVVSARLLQPSAGLWTADVRLAEDEELPAGPLVLSIGGWSGVGTVFRTGPWAGTRAVRLVAGFGGWRTNTTARLYNDANGVKLAAVLKDAAAEVGEQIVVTSTATVGPRFARAMAPASRLLSVLVGREGWYVDPLGVTQIGERPATPITSPFDIPGGGYRPEVGAVTIATEDLGAWLPGAVLDHPLLPEPLQASSVSVHLESGGRLRVEVLV